MLSTRKSLRNSSSLYAASNSVVYRLERGPRRQLQPPTCFVHPRCSCTIQKNVGARRHHPYICKSTNSSTQKLQVLFICKQHVVICFCNKTNAPYQRFRQSCYSWSLIHYRKNLVLGLCWSSQTFAFPSGYWQARPWIFHYKLAVNYVFKNYSQENYNSRFLD